MQKTKPEATSASLVEQAERFDNEAVEYDQRHSSASAQEYRDKFYRTRLLNFDMLGKSVLDAMCATGIDTPFLISQGGKVEGLDISSACARIYEERFGLRCIVGSVHGTKLPDCSYDVVFVSTGLHHVSSLLDETFQELHRILKPGGRLCFVEPNADSWIDGVRRIWYARSNKFGSDERALSYRTELRPYLSLGFVEEEYFTGGNIAYLVFQQANVLKTPAFVAEYMKLPLFALERIVGALPLAPTCYFCARWRKA